MMLKKTSMTRLTITLFALFSFAIMACGGGGGSSTAPAPTPAPTLSVLPADFDFGIVTDGNTAQTAEVTIRNSGTADLSVSDVALSGPNPANFTLNLNGGTNPCVTAASTIAAGSSCTVAVDFSPAAIGIYGADLTIQSNDPTTPTYNMGLLGSKEDILEANVKINQIEACPRPAATVYVSVIDQGGFPITTLVAGDFTITEAGTPQATTSAVRVDASVTLSVALVMDYSGSITVEPNDVKKMEDAAINFVNQLGAGDEAEIIKYATTIEVTQPFTNDKTLLINAIQSTPTVGTHTALFDAIVQAVTDISGSTRDRRAIIVITDGVDDNGAGLPQSISTITDAITDANGIGVPVFTVGLGSGTNALILQRMADETGGTFSDSTTSANLATIYQQLADLLFTDQYILTYTSALAAGGTGDLVVAATYPPTSASGFDTKAILACP
jgi:Ca-activated chloride channel family protein